MYPQNVFIIVILLVIGEILCLNGYQSNNRPSFNYSTANWPSLPNRGGFLNTSSTFNNHQYIAGGNVWSRQNNQHFYNADSILNSANILNNSNNGKDRERERKLEDVDFSSFLETLLNKDKNNAANYINVNYQKKTTSRSKTDEAPEPLLDIKRDITSIPTIEALIPLHNNYIPEVNVNEVYTADEKIEENNFLDTILSTPIMQYTRSFLIDNNKLGKDPKEFKDLLRLIWFNMYSRGGGKIGSSGFEHVFAGEIKNNQISGLHNWVYFASQERSNQLNYLGYLHKIDLKDKGAIVKLHFTFHNIDKPVGSMFIGTSPELELALYTTCFLLKPNEICQFRINNSRFIIRTFSYKYRGKTMIGSAFPEI